MDDIFWKKKLSKGNKQIMIKKKEQKEKWKEEEEEEEKWTLWNKFQINSGPQLPVFSKDRAYNSLKHFLNVKWIGLGETKQKTAKYFFDKSIDPGGESWS